MPMPGARSASRPRCARRLTRRSMSERAVETPGAAARSLDPVKGAEYKVRGGRSPLGHRDLPDPASSHKVDPMHLSARAGFTLIELLVVVSIIVVLLSL